MSITHLIIITSAVNRVDVNVQKLGQCTCYFVLAQQDKQDVSPITPVHSESRPFSVGNKCTLINKLELVILLALQN